MSLKRDDVVASVAVLAPKAKEAEFDQESRRTVQSQEPLIAPVVLPEIVPKYPGQRH